MNKEFTHWEGMKDRTMGLFWITARQVVWRVQSHLESCPPAAHKDAQERRESRSLR
jgi:hypothetical protein